MSSVFERLKRNDRVEFFSDGVLAIVVTLLCIELKVPHLKENAGAKELYEGLWEMRHQFIGFIMSFMFVVMLWTSHVLFFKTVTAIDNNLTWLNNILLLCASFMPFLSSLIGEHMFNPLACAIFGGAITVVSGVLYSMCIYAHKKGLFTDYIDFEKFYSNIKLIGILALVNLLSIPLSFYSPLLAMIYYILFLIVGVTLGWRVKLAQVLEGKKEIMLDE
ncbi:MAG: TMEM175 family protein [Bacteroidetes bacterium]|nr:TMEM175 family protein [Bacteroidota bacterium]